VSRLFWRGVVLSCGISAGVCGFGARAAHAQVDYESGPTALQFNFSNPGARSLALAGALTGAGDDATGAWTNPAGLTNITRPEIGVEFRAFDFSTSFVDGGRFNGAPTGVGADTIGGLLFGTSSDRTRSLSFVSAVVPRSRIAFGAYRTQVVNFESSTSTSGAFFDDPADGLSRAFPADGGLRMTVANIGGSMAVRLTDRLSVGVGLSVYDLSLDSQSARYLVEGGSGLAPGGFFGPPLRTDDNIISTEFIGGDDHALGVNLGVSFAPGERLRLGASYRPGPGFDLEFKRLDFAGEVVGDADSISTLQIPDVFSVGALIKPIAPLNLTVDYRRVRYSQITSGLQTGFGGDPADYVVDDGNEIRAAAEYLFTDLPAPFSALALRGGVWYDPDHRIRYVGPFATDTVLYPKGKDVVHVSGGAGVVFDKVQFDVGFDRSDLVTTFAVSAVLRF
jgi:long-chain fatty acid transport protein